jgi:hypothetical protein
MPHGKATWVINTALLAAISWYYGGDYMVEVSPVYEFQVRLCSYDGIIGKKCSRICRMFRYEGGGCIISQMTEGS